MAAFTYGCEIYENGKWSKLEGVVQPLFDAETLDESLDYGKLKLSMVRRKEKIKINTPIKLIVNEYSPAPPEEGVPYVEAPPPRVYEYKGWTTKIYCFYYMVSNSYTVQRSFVYTEGRDFYYHNLDLIEFTKQLEREICDTLTFTNYLERNFAKSEKTGHSTVVPDPKDRLNLEIIKLDTVLEINNNLVFPSLEELHLKRTALEVPVMHEYSIDKSKCYILVQTPNGTTKLNIDADYYNLEQLGTYTIVYHLYFKATKILTPTELFTKEYDVTYFVSTFEKNQKENTIHNN